MELGVIEGFYGPLWRLPEREAFLACIAGHGYGFYHYAPKADPAVRDHWRTPWTEEQARGLAAFAQACHRNGVRFGIGLTPLGAALPLDNRDRAALRRRLAQLDEIGVDELLLGFDDQSGERPDLAARQAELAHWVHARTRARRLCVCPTYYADDPLLDRLFGQRPAGYLTDLGGRLDPAIDVYWAGPGVCNDRIDPGSVTAVAEQLRRRPLLWDNYPVNDGPDMAPHLHLYAFSGRSPALAGHLAGHAINPALQPTLSAIPALTLAELYRQGPVYDPDKAFRQAAVTVLGSGLAERVIADRHWLQDIGRDGLGHRRRALRQRYAACDHPAAREIVAWLDGAYAGAAVPTQPQD